MRRLVRATLLAATALACLASPRPARADLAACIAANEAEVALRKVGKLHQALEQLTLCAAPSCPVEISKECKRRIGLVNAAQPTILVAATDGAGNDLAAVTVTIDGQPFLTKLDGLPVAIDPGNHVLHFEAEGNPPLDRAVVIQEGEKDRRIAVVLGEVKTKANAPGAAAPSAWTTNKSLAVAAGGVGVLGVALGSVFGILSFSQASTAKSDCTAAACTPAGHASAESEHSTAATSGTVSTIGFVVGGLALAGGIALWVTAPKSEPTKPAAVGLVRVRLTPLLTTQGASMLVGGSFE
jgi:hypothetical protein